MMVEAPTIHPWSREFIDRSGIHVVGMVVVVVVVVRCI